MTSTPRARVVLLGGFGGVLALQVPFAYLADRLTGNTGGLVFIVPLLAFQCIECIGSVHRHLGLVWGTTLVFYLGLYSVVAIPTHLAFRRRARAHPIAIGFVSLLFIGAVAFAFPIGKLDL